jgi:hypothetical protein
LAAVGAFGVAGLFAVVARFAPLEFAAAVFAVVDPSPTVAEPPVEEALLVEPRPAFEVPDELELELGVRRVRLGVAVSWGRARPTPFMTSPALSATVPATVPAASPAMPATVPTTSDTPPATVPTALPTRLMALPASGIWRSPLVAAGSGHGAVKRPPMHGACPRRAGYDGAMTDAPAEHEQHEHEWEIVGEAETWHRLHALVDRITPEEAEVPGYFEEGWTAKDAIAHLGTWMAQGAANLRQIAAGTYREGELDIDAANARFLEAMRDVPLPTIHLQLSAAHGELMAAWSQLHEITPPAAFWVRKAGPEHIEEHLPRLEGWIAELERRPKG